VMQYQRLYVHPYDLLKIIKLLIKARKKSKLSSSMKRSTETNTSTGHMLRILRKLLYAIGGHVIIFMK
jgi:hypothetical protein